MPLNWPVILRHPALRAMARACVSMVRANVRKATQAFFASEMFNVLDTPFLRKHALARYVLHTLASAAATVLVLHASTQTVWCGTSHMHTD